MEGETPAEEFEVKLSGPGIHIERTVSRQIAGQIMGAVLGVHAAAQGTQQPLSSAGTGVQTSLREYLDEVQAARKTDQIVAIGHYMSVHEQTPTFSRDDVKTRFASAKEPMPANFPRDFNVAIRAGMIAEAHQQPGYFYVTKTGIHAVERRFADDSKRQRQ